MQIVLDGRGKELPVWKMLAALYYCRTVKQEIKQWKQEGSMRENNLLIT